MKYCFLLLMISFLVNAQDSKDADQLFATGNYSKAITAYESSETINHNKIAKAYVAIGNFEMGLKHYEKAIGNHPEDELLSYDYAKLLTRTKKYDKSKYFLSELIKKDSLNPNYHYELGLVLEKQRDTLALDEFQKTFFLDSSHQKAIFKIAKHYLIKRQFEKVHDLTNIGLADYENNIELISLKAQAYYHQDYHKESIKWFNNLMDLGETSEFIHEKISLSYAYNSDYEKAIHHRKMALNYSPFDADAMFVIGEYYSRLNDFNKAEEFMSKALKIQDVSLSNEYQRLGVILNRQKKYEQAIKAFKKSLKEDPKNMLSEFYIIRTKDEYYADLDTKISLYENFVKKHKKNPFVSFAKKRLKELKKEKFLQEE